MAVDAPLLGIALGPRGRHLDGDVPPGEGIAPQIDGAGGALPQLADDLVFAEFLSIRQSGAGAGDGRPHLGRAPCRRCARGGERPSTVSTAKTSRRPGEKACNSAKESWGRSTPFCSAALTAWPTASWASRKGRPF